MKLTLDEVNYGKGFTSENDIFNRRKLGMQLQNIIKNSEDDSLVLAIDDQWGSGKTTFLKMWETELIIDNDLEVIYFDAFKNDYQEDAFLALSSAIYPKIEKEEDKQEFLKAAKQVGKFVVKAGIKVGLRAATLGLVKDTDLEGIEDTTKEIIEEPIEKLIEEKLKSAEKEEGIIQHFKHTITDSAKDKKIVFIVDELDRARPDFSLDLLEKMKHVFNTKNLFFVLAVNKDQFLHIINKRYGKIDSETYLSKFVHFWFSLPQSREQYTNISTTTTVFINHLKKSLKIDNNFDVALAILTELLKHDNASLRDCERCYSLMKIVIAGNIPKEQEYQYAIATLIFIKVKKPQAFKDYFNQSMTPDKLFEAINILKLKELTRGNMRAMILTDLLDNDELIKAQENNERIIKDLWGEPNRAMTSILPHFETIQI
ncbi:KAP family P-loop NTPase fold protein [Pantoea anthophila]|uniref:KAP family P-loop NTPase fold protein n=1 Tax=Pantoea anthophila TaxID=470931 RepID=UPI00301CB42D